MPQDDPATIPALSTSDQRVLARVFQHPLSHNLSWREALGLVATLGSVSHAQDGDVVLRVGQVESRFKQGRDKDLSAEALMALRHFLTRAGWGDTTPDVAKGPATRDTVVVIDHAGARVFYATNGDDATPQELHHLLHDTDRSCPLPGTPCSLGGTPPSRLRADPRQDCVPDSGAQLHHRNLKGAS